MKQVFIVLLTLPSVTGYAQLSHGGSPLGWGAPADHFVVPPCTVLPPVPHLPHAAATGGPSSSRLGEQRALSVDVLASGVWASLPDGGRVCRYMLRSPGAAMMGVQFDVFQLPPGARAFLYDRPRSTFIGSFTSANAQASGGLATALLPGDAVIVEYQEPPNAATGGLHIASITHAWQDIFSHAPNAQGDIDPGYQSSPCQNNVVCPIAADWQDQVRATVMFMRPDGSTCSGVLLNNTQQDGTPYLLTANHCYESNEDQWVFYFNYESPTCVGDTGQTQQTLTGATRRAWDYSRDFCLMELNDMPPPDYGVYYAGWDRSGAPPLSGATIGHPLSDVKKISFYNVPATTVPSEIDASVPAWQDYWYSGIIESGCSGSGLFDQNRRVVGHVTDSDQSCATALTAPGFSSKFSGNWDGPDADTRLRDWLDPANTSITLDGYDPNGTSPTVRVKAKAMLQGPYLAATNMMTADLDDAGLLPLVEPYTGLGYVHSGGGGGETTIQAVLDVGGINEVVDWVVVELRDKDDPSVIIASRSALLRRDGTIVDMDGISDVAFSGLPADLYYVAVRHRNHLGIMTATAQPLTATANLIDLTSPATALYGGEAATDEVNGTLCLWSGDVNRDNVVSYAGAQNDRDPILLLVGGGLPTAVVNGYMQEDINLDGVVKYTGLNNDRDVLLPNIGSLPTGQRFGTIPD